MAKEKPTLQESLKKDATYQRYKSIRATVVEGLDIERTMKEAKYLHRNRKARTLHEVRVSPQKLQDAVLLDLSNRSRMVELQALLLNQQELLSTAISLCKKHVRTQYADVIQSFGSTKDAQNLLMDRVFSSGLRVLSEIDGALNILSLYIKDIDQAGFGLSRTAETLKMVLDRKESY